MATKMARVDGRALSSMSIAIKPVLKYPGAKWHRAEWIISYLPAHTVYVEPYVGSGAIFFNKPQVKHEVLNDLSSSIINLFAVIRTRGQELAAAIEMTPWSRAEYELVERNYSNTGDELEDARRFLIRCWQAHGTRLSYTSGWRHKGVHGGSGETVSLWNKLPARILAVTSRLKDAELECRPALDIIDRYNAPQVLLYVDPPYLLSTRSGAFYEHEMSDSHHLSSWYRVQSPALTEGGNVRNEVLWLNPKAAQAKQLHLFENNLVESEG